MIEYEILPETWSNLEATYWHPETKEDEKRMWEYIENLEKEEHCTVHVWRKEQIA